METLILDKKKYVVIEQSEFKNIQIKAAMNEPLISDRISLKEAKKRAFKLFDKWDKEK